MACSLSQLILTCMYYIPTFQGINNFSTPENRLRTGRPLSLYNIFHEETKTVGCASCFTTGSPKEAQSCALLRDNVNVSIHWIRAYLTPMCSLCGGSTVYSCACNEEVTQQFSVVGA